MLTENANKVLEQRYLQPNEDWQRLCKRVAGHVAQEPQHYPDYFSMLHNQLMLPNSPCLMAAGTELPQLCACFVLPVSDSMESIFQAVKETALVHKTGGGTGFDFSPLRPSSAQVNSTQGTASGPISFMKVFNAATDQVKQGGRRKGANMGVLRADHPEIRDFINCKQLESDLTNFNLSVMLTPEVMDDGDPIMSLRHPRSTFRFPVMKSDILDQIAERIWHNGEPGILFEDTINQNVEPGMEVSATNPCVAGDTLITTTQGTRRIDSLVNAKVDVYTMDDSGSPAIRPAKVFKTKDNASLLRVVTAKGTIKVTPDHLIHTREHGWVPAELLQPGYTVTGLNWQMANETQDRRVQKVEKLDTLEPVYDLQVEDTHNYVANGMIVHNCGEAPLLPYEACVLGSINLPQLFDPICGFMWDELEHVTRTAVRFLDDVIDASQFPLDSIATQVRQNRKLGLGMLGLADLLYMARIPYDSEEGRIFAMNIARTIQMAGWEMSAKLGKARGAVYKHYRNRSITAQAPTGTLSLIANATPGIEPVFSHSVLRKVMDGQHMYETNQYVQEALRSAGVSSYADLPERERQVFKTAQQIAPEDHVKMQATVQEFIDLGVSKTINLPNGATVDQIKEIIQLAYQTGCKGLTMYRDGSRDEQVLNCVECQI